MSQSRAGRVDSQSLKTAPIPADWILDGEPQARVSELAHSPDGTCMTAHWDCTAGTFRWYFGVEETVHVVEGEVHVQYPDGRELTVRAGDVAVMPANQWMVWHVPNYVRKVAHCRYPVPSLLGRVLRKLQTLRNDFALRRKRNGGRLLGAGASQVLVFELLELVQPLVYAPIH